MSSYITDYYRSAKKRPYAGFTQFERRVAPRMGLYNFARGRAFGRRYGSFTTRRRQGYGLRRSTAFYRGRTRTRTRSRRRRRFTSRRYTSFKRRTNRRLHKLEIEAQDTKITHRFFILDNIVMGYADAGINAQVAHIQGFDKHVRDGLLTQLRFYDEETNSIVVKDLHIVSRTGPNWVWNIPSIHYTYRFWNNYRTPAAMEYWLVRCKQDTDDPPNTCWTNGGALNTFFVGTTTGMSYPRHCKVYPSDSETFNNYWHIVKKGKRWIQPGQHFTVRHSVKNVEYRPNRDVSAGINAQTVYVAKEKHFSLMVRLLTWPAHAVGGSESIAPLHAGATCAIDFSVHRTINMCYNGGFKAQMYYVHEDAYNTRTAGVPDNPGAFVSESVGVPTTYKGGNPENPSPYDSLMEHKDDGVIVHSS